MIQTVFDALESALQSQGITVAKGPEHLGDNQSPPYVVLIPGEEMFGGPAPRFVTTRRVLHTRSVSVKAGLWGKDWDATEQLVGLFIYVLRCVVGTSYEIIGGRWTQQDNASLVQMGRRYDLEFRILAPVVVPEGQDGSAIVQQTDTTDTTLPFDGTVIGG